ncbi:S8 family serine peptidase [Halobacillus sp. MO56]
MRIPFSHITVSLFTLLLSSFLLLSPVEGHADKGTTDQEWLIHGNDKDLRHLVNELEKTEEIAVNFLEDINMIKVSAISQDEKKRMLQTIEREKLDVVMGEDSPVHLPDPFSFSTMSDLPLVNYTNSIFSTAQLYEEWGWDIKEVTNNGASFEKQLGNHDVVVAIIDSGIDHQHPDLKDNILSEGKSFVPGVESTQDKMGHGTMVAGSIAANGSLLGVGPQLGIIPYKVFDQSSGKTSWVVSAMIEAVNAGSDVINLSLGSYLSVKNSEDRAALLAYKKAINYANQKGTAVVAASGTRTQGIDISNPKLLGLTIGTDDPTFYAPGGLNGVITVSGSTRTQTIDPMSNYGQQVELSAPSGDYGPEFQEKGEVDFQRLSMTTYPTDLPSSPLNQYLGIEEGYTLMVGTSLAAPKVSAAIALLIAEAKEEMIELPLREIYSLINEGAMPYNPDVTDEKQSRYGIVNVNNSLKLLNEKGGNDGVEN